MKLNPITLTLTLLIVTLAGCTGGSSSDDTPYTGNGNDVSGGSNNGEPRHLKFSHDGNGVFEVVEVEGTPVASDVSTRSYQGSTETTTSLLINEGSELYYRGGCQVNGEGIRNPAKDCVRYVNTLMLVGDQLVICQIDEGPVADKIVFTDLETGNHIGTFNLSNIQTC